MNSSNPEKDNPIASKGKGWGGIGICLPLGEGRDYDPYRLQCGLEQLPSLSQPQSRGRDASRSRPKVQSLKEFSAHQLRHTMAITLYDAGVDVKSAQKFLGHSDIQVTLKIYTHLSEGKEQAAVDALNRHLGE